MAQTKERSQPQAKSPAKGAQRSSAPASSTPKSRAPWENWLARLRGPLTTAPRPSGPNGQPRPRSTIFKSFFGILIWFVASQLIMYLLILLDSALRKPGELPPLETIHLFPPNTPLLGWVTPFLLLYGGTVIGLWFLLIRFNLIPRDFFGARAQAEERARRQAGATTVTGATTGPRKTRAQRRYSDTQTQAQVQANAKGGKNGAKPAAKGATGATKPVAKASETRATTKGASPSAETNDEAYDRVRSADRLRRRREAKR